MPPFTTLNGQTGYFDNNGQFIPATQEEYNQQFGMLQQFGGNPFLNAAQQSTLNNQRTNFVQQGTIETPVTAAQTNEQKVMQAQGDNTPILGVGNMPYVKMGDQYGVQKGKSFYPFDAMTASGHPLNTVTNTVFNTGDLTSFRKGKIANPYAAEMALMQSQNTANFLNNLSNKTSQTAPVQTQVTNPIQAATTAITEPEITPTPTADQSGGGNWLSNMFNKPSVESVPTTTTTPIPNKEFNGKEFFSSEKGQDISALTGAGVGLATTLVKASAQDKYDPRVGMSKPNLTGNLFGDATFTQVGLNPALMAATGGISALVGGGVDLIKNAVKYAKQKDRYENKKLGVDTMQSIDDARENMKPDYTGYARFGTQVKNPYIEKYKPGGEANGTPTYSWSFSGSPSTFTQLAPIGKEHSVGTTVPSVQGYFISNDLFNNTNNPVPETKPKFKIYEAINSMNNMTTNDGLDNEGNKIPYDNKTFDEKRLDKSHKEAKQNLIDIYTSPGYKEKLENEIEQSKIMGYGKTYNYSKNIGEPSYYTSYDANKKADDIINEKLYRIKNTPVSLMAHDDKSIENAYGYMAQKANSYYSYPYIKMNPFMIPNQKSTLLEELEHAAHIKKDLIHKGYTNLNITPYAKHIFDNYAPATSKESVAYSNNYLDKYTEKMAKKRAAEQWLIDNKKLKPGEKVKRSHYDYLLNNYNELPSNVKSLLDMTNENDWIEYNTKLYIDFRNNQKKYIEDSNKTKDNIEYLNNLKEESKKSDKSFLNFLMIMNKIAMNSNNPYVQTARFGIFIKPENRGKFTKWAQSNDMGVQEAANTVMDNKEEYQPEIVKMANFAKNSKKWK